MKRVLPILFVFLLALTAAAGERLPSGVLAHVSAKSLTALVTGLDALATASVKDTPAAQQYQPGMLVMMTGMFSPLPQNAWDAKAEIHAVAAIAKPMNPQYALILKTAGMAAFKKALLDGGITFKGDDKKMLATMPKLGLIWYMADAGNGRMVCSPDEATRDLVVKTLASGWSPKHIDNADLALNLDMKNFLTAFKPAFDAYMGQAKQALTAQAGKANPDSPLTPVLSKVMANALAAFEADAPALNNFGMDLSFSGDRLKLAFSLSSDKGSGLDNLRAVYAGGERPKYALANSFPKEAVLVDAMADLSKFPDGWVKFYENALRDIGGAVMPARANDLAALPRRILALGIKNYTAGSYLTDGRPVMAFYFEHANAKGTQDFLSGTIKLWQEFMNGLVKMDKTGKVQAIAVDYQPAAGKLGNVSYQRISYKITPPGGGNPVAYDMLFAIGGKIVAGVYGQVNERDLHYAITNYQNPTGGFLNSDPAKKTMADIGDNRIRFTEFKPLETLANFYVSQAALAGIDPKAAQAKMAGLRASPACMALAAGATDKLLTFECVIPAEVVADFIRNSGTLTSLGSELTSAGIDSSGEADGDDLAADEDEGDGWDTTSQADSDESVADNDTADNETMDKGAAATAASIHLAQDAFGPDDDVEVAVTDVGEAMERDKAFVAIYRAGADHGDYGQYFHVPEGDSHFVFNSPDFGDYEMRLYRRDGEYSDETLVATVPFSMVDDGEPATLALNKSEYRADGTIAATVRNASKHMQNANAFVAIYKPGAGQSEYAGYAYLTRKNGTIMLPVPKENGEYEMRLHKSESNYSDETVLAVVPFTVTGN